MKKICKICNNKVTVSKNLFFTYNYLNKNRDGKFLNCKNCKTFMKFSSNYKYLYENRNSTNYSNSFFFSKLKFFFLKLSLSKYLKKVNYNAKILDFGCGSGELSEVILSMNYKKITATDLIKERPKYLKKNILYLPINKIDKKLFNVIFARHVFEHIQNLKKIFLLFNKISYSKSLIIIEIPNYDSIWRKILKSFWPGFFFPYHEYIYSKESFSKVLRKNNFTNFKVFSANPPIFGLFFVSMGLGIIPSKILSIIFYPIQALVSLIFSKPESLVFKIYK